MKQPTAVRYAESFPVQIFIAGDYDTAVSICRKYCDEIGFCVTVTKTNYVYTNGMEDGVIVGLINYPRFTSEPAEITHHAGLLAEKLLEGLNQQSYSIQTPVETQWVSYRRT